jgi:SAM-dependent methyltransferase
MTTTAESTPQSTLEFWNRHYLSGAPGERTEPIMQAALAHFGDVQGKRILDVGCGTGSAAIFFAGHGARVVGIDISSVGVQTLRDTCASKGIGVQAEVCSAMDIENLGAFDFVFGNMILHHLEPFERFAAKLAGAIAPGGKAFFHENSARSGAMVWFREHLVGRFGIPKFGDKNEFPLEPREIEALAPYFDVRCEFPELMLFRLIPAYLLRGHLGWLGEGLDSWFYKRRFLNRYSYRQYVLLSKR